MMDVVASEIHAWITSRLPDGWSTDCEVHVDREEIVVLVPIPPDGDDPLACATRFREASRDDRVRVAEEAEARFGRKVSWGVRVDGERYLFTHAAVPVMTRLRYAERAVLDTLIDAGVARSRSEALAWCVRLVERHQGEWIGELRDALEHVERARRAGPQL